MKRITAIAILASLIAAGSFNADASDASIAHRVQQEIAVLKDVAKSNGIPVTMSDAEISKVLTPQFAASYANGVAWKATSPAEFPADYLRGLYDQIKLPNHENYSAQQKAAERVVFVEAVRDGFEGK